MGELVVDAVQVILVVLVPLALRLPGRQAAGVVRVRLEGGELGQGVGFALEGDLGGSQQLLILGGQVVLLLELGDDLRGEGLELDLRIDKQQIAVLRLKILAEGGGQHGRGPRLHVLLELGESAVPEGLLPVVELVPGVDGVAHAGQGGLGVDVLQLLLLLQEHGLGLLVAGGALQPLHQAGQGLLHPLQVGALIGHLGKLHDDSSLMYLERTFHVKRFKRRALHPALPGPAARPRSCSPG